MSYIIMMCEIVWKWSGLSLYQHASEKVLKGIDLEENLKITLTSLTFILRDTDEHSKTFWKILMFFLKKNCHFMLHLHSRNHSEYRILSKFSKTPPNQTHAFMLCARASQISGGSVQIFFNTPMPRTTISISIIWFLALSYILQANKEFNYFGLLRQQW